MIDAGVVLVPHLGEAEVCPLAGVTGHDVIDDAAAVAFGGIAERAELGVGAEDGVDLGADAIEVPIDARCLLPSRDPTGSLDGARVDRADADALEG